MVSADYASDKGFSPAVVIFLGRPPTLPCNQSILPIFGQNNHQFISTSIILHKFLKVTLLAIFREGKYKLNSTPSAAPSEIIVLMVVGVECALVKKLVAGEEGHQGGELLQGKGEVGGEGGQWGN